MDNGENMQNTEPLQNENTQPMGTEAPQPKNKNRMIIVGIIAAILIAAIGGYTYYRHTPTYTFQLIQEAVQKHDYASFQKHVDTKNLLSTAIDDALDMSLEEDKSLNNSTRQMARGFMAMLKPSIVEALDSEIEQYIKTGSQEKAKAGNKADNIASNMQKKADADSLTFKKIGSTRKDGDFCIADVIFTNEKLGKDVTLSFKMKKLEDGTWQILQIVNLKDYLKDVQQEQKAQKQQKPQKQQKK